MSKVLKIVLASILIVFVFSGCDTNKKQVETPNYKTTQITPNFQKIETDGNLEVTNNLECINFEDVKSTYTPVDLFNGIYKCIEKNEYEKASKLFTVALIYAKFDTLRVADKTAHQAFAVLKINLAQKIGEEKTNKLQNEIAKNKEDFCKYFEKLEYPTYYPRYMIQHGIKAFTNPNDNKGLVDGFNPAKAWNEDIKIQYAKCGNNVEITTKKEEPTKTLKFALVEAMAKKGDIKSQNELAVAYATGNGVKQNFKEAIIWWEKAANQGDKVAQKELGAINYTGANGVAKDYQKAFYWTEKSAKQGYGEAQHNLGTFYYGGYGIKQDYEKSKEWFEKACDNGISISCKDYEAVNSIINKK
ncbi:MULTISPECIES: tetratricopeptide repeat protein [Arcobacteraceae]|uniref:beta-lactamase n=1 Tax=Aliarcobacter butzleri L352 TaxID=1447260 RepID=A0A837JB60_9BACT|nr:MULTISPECIES: tetratricopeptide repeat protein [Arcobacteraceae]KLE04017.1 hypothetical protein AF77_07935 [Aliarcobacter butzleri L352]MCT7591252.1 sel1 repeat family protein [Aliarcobacter butzleri]MCT7908612.1 sel1 repeat family protein [Arcobacter lacus]MDH1975472.1 sel1 repeat family protein [Aliarcobacter butzleri]